MNLLKELMIIVKKPIYFYMILKNLMIRLIDLKKEVKKVLINQKNF